MTTATAPRGKTRYKYITAFSRHIDTDRTWVFDLLERNDPEMWRRYSEFRTKKASDDRSQVEAAKLKIQKLEQC